MITGCRGMCKDLVYSHLTARNRITPKWISHQICFISEIAVKWCLIKHNSSTITVTSSAMQSQITGVSIVYSTVCLGVDQRKHQSSASLAFVRGIHRWPVNSPHKGPVTRNMCSFDDVIMHVWKVELLSACRQDWNVPFVMSSHGDTFCITDHVFFVVSLSKLFKKLLYYIDGDLRYHDAYVASQ